MEDAFRIQRVELLPKDDQGYAMVDGRYPIRRQFSIHDDTEFVALVKRMLAMSGHMSPVVLSYRPEDAKRLSVLGYDPQKDYAARTWVTHSDPPNGKGWGKQWGFAMTGEQLHLIKLMFESSSADGSSGARLYIDFLAPNDMETECKAVALTIGDYVTTFPFTKCMNQLCIKDTAITKQASLSGTLMHVDFRMVMSQKSPYVLLRRGTDGTYAYLSSLLYITPTQYIEKQAERAAKDPPLDRFTLPNPFIVTTVNQTPRDKWYKEWDISFVLGKDVLQTFSRLIPNSVAMSSAFVQVSVDGPPTAQAKLALILEQKEAKITRAIDSLTGVLWWSARGLYPSECQNTPNGKDFVMLHVPVTLLAFEENRGTPSAKKCLWLYME